MNGMQLVVWRKVWVTRTLFNMKNKFNILVYRKQSYWQAFNSRSADYLLLWENDRFSFISGLSLLNTWWFSLPIKVIDGWSYESGRGLSWPCILVYRIVIDSSFGTWHTIPIKYWISDFIVRKYIINVFDFMWEQDATEYKLFIERWGLFCAHCTIWRQGCMAIIDEWAPRRVGHLRGWHLLGVDGGSEAQRLSEAPEPEGSEAQPHSSLSLSLLQPSTWLHPGSETSLAPGMKNHSPLTPACPSIPHPFISIPKVFTPAEYAARPLRPPYYTYWLLFKHVNWTHPSNMRD